ncbi:MAG: tyrosinase family protein [Roseimicrobium sp.]
MNRILLILCFALSGDGMLWSQPSAPAKQKKAAILVFSVGPSCQYCTEQFESFRALAPVLTQHGIELTFAVEDGEPWKELGGIRIAKAAELRKKITGTIPEEQSLRHATFVLNRDGGIVWRHTGQAPFLNAAQVAGAALQTEFSIEIEINNTPEATDDYLTWAPTPARIRVTKAPEGVAHVNVTLTNTPQTATPGPDNPKHGMLAFDWTVPAGQTCAQSSLTLPHLPTDGSWKTFHVAGSYPDASSRDKDAIIEIHLEASTGPMVTSHAAMVRARKNVDSLTPFERIAFLKALHDLHVGKKGYELLPTIHDLAAKGKSPYQNLTLPDGTLNPKFWPDQAHADAAFLAWHRAFLLQIERSLQAINPAVTIPYWRQNAPTNAMAANFLGTNRRRDGSFQSEVIFSPSNWLYGWNIRYQNLKTVVRSTRDNSSLLRPNGQILNGDLEFFPGGVPLSSNYGEFRALETNPHNFGHGILNSWHNNCLISPSDPSFWSFHAEHDRLWAKWQHLKGAFDPTGRDGVSYDKIGTFRADDAASASLGHNVEDTMWPWDGSKGRVIADQDAKGTRPDANPFPTFPKSKISGLWPSKDESPSPGAMIDYLGLQSGNLNQGVCYDDVPYGIQPPPSPPPPPPFNALLAAEVLGEVAIDENVPLDRRTRALRALTLTNAGKIQEIPLLLAEAKETPVELRDLAINTIISSDPHRGFDVLLQSIARKDSSEKFARTALVAQAPIAHLTLLSKKTTQELHRVLVETAAGPDAELAARANMALAMQKDKNALDSLKALIKSPSPPVPRAALAAAFAENADDAPVYARDLLETALTQFDFDTILVLLRVLAGDATTQQRRLALVSDENNGPTIQGAAMRSLMHETSDVGDKCLGFLEAVQPSSVNLLQLESVGVIRVVAESVPPSKARLQDWVTRLEVVEQRMAGASVANAAEFRQALSMSLEVMRSLIQP